MHNFSKTLIFFLTLVVFIPSMAVGQSGQISGDPIDPLTTMQIPKRSQINNASSRPNASAGGERAMMVGPVLHDQSELVNYPAQGFGGADASGTTGNLFGYTSSTSSNIRTADDIVVPPGEKWLIDSIEFIHYQTGSGTASTINDMRMQIIKGSTPVTASVVYGDLTTNRLHLSSFTGIYRVQPPTFTAVTRPVMKSSVVTSGLTLSAGTYWIEYMAGGTLTSGPFVPQRTLGTTHISTGNGYQYNGGWVMVTELNTTGSNPQPKGFPLIVYGVSAEDKAAEVNGIKYNTLQDAINAATMDGTVVTLLKDVDEASASIGPFSIIIDGDIYGCKLNQLNITNGKYLKWIQNTLMVTGSINNNSSGILWNNAIVTCSNFINTGIYKGTGNFNGNLANNNLILPGN
ncbi:MAG: hypothetical protein U0V54_05530 [Saprospiraceae bacterium]